MNNIFILLTILSIVFNIINTIYMAKVSNSLDMFIHALMPTIIGIGNATFLIMLFFIFKVDSTNITPIIIITSVIIDVIFLLINAFTIISKSIERKKDRDVTFGLLFLFLLPVVFMISLPLSISLYFIKKFNCYNDAIKVTEEEIFEEIYSAKDYLD